MAKVPRLSGSRAIRASERAGWEVTRQRGSQVVLTKPGSIYTLSIPLHRVLALGLLREQIRKAGLTVDEFIELL